jgi:hypothetical protein
MVNKNIVFLSYGNEPEYLRAIFCILSLTSWVSPDELNYNLNRIRIIIYTDNFEYFQKRIPELQIQYVQLTPPILKEMVADTGFFHRIKVCVIAQTFNDYPGDDLLFIDTDTFFYNKPEKLLKGFNIGNSFMHMREYPIENGVDIFSAFQQEEYPRAFINYINHEQFNINNQLEKFNAKDYCWNSGVLGLDSEFSNLMPDVLSLTDKFYANSKWFISEQLAFALILQRRGNIEATDELIFHYWGKRQKALMSILITQLFQQNPPSELVNSKTIRSLTKRWKIKITNDVILEKAVISLQQNYWLYGFKKALQVILKDPFNSGMYRQLFAAAVA